MDWSDPSTVIACAGVIVALLYTVLTGFIWYATWQNTKATKDILAATYRPYVGITRVWIVFETLLDSHLSFTVTNAGSGPARSIEIGIEVYTSRKATHQPDADASQQPISLLPNQTLDLSRNLVANLDAKPEVVFTVRYKGMTNQSYATYATYIYTGPNGEFEMTTGQFE